MEHRFGTHIVRIEEDIGYIQFIGDLTPADLSSLLSIVDDIIAQHGRYGAVIDARQMGAVSPATRRLLSQWKGSEYCYGNAVFGQGFAVRVSMTMAMRAVQLFTGRSFPVAFFNTETESKSWLRTRRKSFVI